MKKITLTQGKLAMVDEEYFEHLNKLKWYLSNRGYAVRTIYLGHGGNRKQRKIAMHRIINNTPHDMETDHINGNRLDNRNVNLRSCHHRENQRNRVIQKNNTTGYTGVIWFKRGEKWRAQIYITKNGIQKSIHLGYFFDKKLAIKAYDQAAKKYYGNFANLNFKEKNV